MVYLCMGGLMVKKLAFVLFSAWVAFAPFNYGIARIECASMMQVPASPSSIIQTADHDCCDPAACQCEIKAPSGERSLPADIIFSRIQTRDGVVSSIPVFSRSIACPSASLLFSPPPEKALFKLYSVYRL
jgi:hypothetical protein